MSSVNLRTIYAFAREMYPKNVATNIQYGTAGFRTRYLKKNTPSVKKKWIKFTCGFCAWQWTFLADKLVCDAVRLHIKLIYFDTHISQASIPNDMTHTISMLNRTESISSVCVWMDATFRMFFFTRNTCGACNSNRNLFIFHQQFYSSTLTVTDEFSQYFTTIYGYICVLFFCCGLCVYTRVGYQ